MELTHLRKEESKDEIIVPDKNEIKWCRINNKYMLQDKIRNRMRVTGS